jgi:DNA repair protein RecO (recombination protein O)
MIQTRKLFSKELLRFSKRVLAVHVKEKVFILRASRYGDADLILNCLTPAGARINLFARSALKSKKRFGGGVLEPTHYIHVTYEDKSSRRSESPLHTLKEASLIEDFKGLRTDYERIELGLHMVRLVAEVVREGDVNSEGLFNLLGNSLRAAEKSTHLDWLKTQFEAKLLSNQGVLPVEDEEEAALLRAGISENEGLEISDDAWMRVRSRIKRVLAEYLGEKRSVTI